MCVLFLAPEGTRSSDSDLGRSHGAGRENNRESQRLQTDIVAIGCPHCNQTVGETVEVVLETGVTGETVIDCAVRHRPRRGFSRRAANRRQLSRFERTE